MSGTHLSTLVYSRRKQDKLPPSNSRRSGESLSVISSDIPSVAPQNGISENRSDIEGITVSSTPNGGSIAANPPIWKSDFCSTLKLVMQKNIEVDSLNDSCSSSKSNLEPLCKDETQDAGECSSSSVIVADSTSGNSTEKNVFISSPSEDGQVEGVSSPRTLVSISGINAKIGSICPELCKVCGFPGSAVNMLLCDDCEDAYHLPCCYPLIMEIPTDEWYCNSCLRNKEKILIQATMRKSCSITSSAERNGIESSRADLNPITLMLCEPVPHTSFVRVGKGFQAEVPEWSGPVDKYVDMIGEPLGNDPLCPTSCTEMSHGNPSKRSSVGNWLQCRQVIEGLNEETNGTICGKWRRAPLYEMQTDNWECFCSFLWDPSHADCAVPQELETEEVLKQLKYIEMLRPRLLSKRQKSNHCSGKAYDNVPRDMKDMAIRRHDTDISTKVTFMKTRKNITLHSSRKNIMFNILNRR